MNAPTALPGFGETANLLLDQQSIAQYGSYSLSGSIKNYNTLLVLLSNTNNANEVKPYYIPVAIARSYTRFDCSWNATDSTSWYIVCTITFASDTSIEIPKLQKAGFTDARLIIYGLK